MNLVTSLWVLGSGKTGQIGSFPPSYSILSGLWLGLRESTRESGQARKGAAVAIVAL